MNMNNLVRGRWNKYKKSLSDPSKAQLPSIEKFLGQEELFATEEEK